MHNSVPTKPDPEVDPDPEVTLDPEVTPRVDPSVDPREDAAFPSSPGTDPSQPIVSVDANDTPPPTMPAAASALNRNRPARLSRGGGTGSGLSANEGGHGTPQKGQRDSVKRMWRAHDGQASRRAGIPAV